MIFDLFFDQFQCSIYGMVKEFFMKPNYTLKGLEIVVYSIALFFGAVVFVIVVAMDMFF